MDVKSRKFDMSTICRCCRVIDGIRVLLTSFFNTKDKTYKVDEMYAYCINSQVMIEGHPKYICVNCLQQLIATYDFRKKCIESNMWFQKNGQKSFQLKNPIAKNELIDHDYAKNYDQKIISTKSTTKPIHEEPKTLPKYPIKIKKTVPENPLKTKELINIKTINNDFRVEPKDKERALEDLRAEMILTSILQDAENGIMNIDSPEKIVKPTNQDKLQIRPIAELQDPQINKSLAFNRCELSRNSEDYSIDVFEEITIEESHSETPKSIRIEESTVPQKSKAVLKPMPVVIKKEIMSKISGGKVQIKLKEGQVIEKTLNIVKSNKEKLPKVVPNDKDKAKIMEQITARKLMSTEKYGEKDLSGYYTCTICQKRVKDIRHHMYSHSGIKRFKCKICGREFYRNRNFKNHMLSHAGIRNFECNICHKKFVTTDILRVHKLVHEKNKRHLCSYCGKGFVYKGTLITHIRQHTGEKPLKCKFCDKCFADHTSLLSHHRTHTGEKPHLCHYCGKSFAQVTQLKGHTRIHTGEKPYPCSYCERKFRTNSLRTIHTRAAHTGERPFTCDICNKSFYTNGKLTDHRKTHNKDKQYPCNHCDKHFRTKAALKNHLSTHNDYKKYECEECECKFAKKGDLKEHIQSIHPELVQENTKYNCRICNAEFESMAILNEHKKMHGSDNYTCRYCFKIFTSTSGLAGHVTRIHSEETDYRSTDSSSEENSNNSYSESHSS